MVAGLWMQVQVEMERTHIHVFFSRRLRLISESFLTFEDEVSRLSRVTIVGLSRGLAPRRANHDLLRVVS